MEQKQKKDSAETIEPHILLHFNIREKIGSGAYGHVWKVEHIKTSKLYALKKIFDAFQNATDAQRTFRQVSVLRQLNHQNIIKLVKVIRSENQMDLYLLFEFMSADLHTAIRQNILQMSHRMFVTYQIAKAIKYLHSAQIIHRDLKPSNVLINEDSHCKLCDFGLVRYLVNPQGGENSVLTEHVATRWYRSPEILLGCKDYSKPTDIWSFGCIVAEMLIGKPIFQGKSTFDQMEKVIEFTGPPTSQQLRRMNCEDVEQIVKSIKVQRIDPNELFKGHDERIIDLIIKCLKFDPKQRPTAEDIVSHPFLQSFRVPHEEITCPLPMFCPINDNQKFTVQQYRNIIGKMADLYKQTEQVQRTEVQNFSKHQESVLAPKQFNIKNRKLIRSIGKKQHQSISQWLAPYLNENRFISPYRRNLSFKKQNSLQKKPLQSLHQVNQTISLKAGQPEQKKIKKLIPKRRVKKFT